MTNHQKQLWQNMIDLIEDYIKGTNNDFCDLGAHKKTTS